MAQLYRHKQVQSKDGLANLGPGLGANKLFRSLARNETTVTSSLNCLTRIMPSYIAVKKEEDGLSILLHKGFK